MNVKVPSREDRAWCAGFFDGEGNTHVRKKNSYIQMGIGQCADNREVLDRFQTIIGVGKVYGPYTHKGGREQLKLIVTSFSRVQYVIAMLWPWLGTEKRDQAQRCLLDFRDYWRPIGYRNIGAKHPEHAMRMKALWERRRQDGEQG